MLTVILDAPSAPEWNNSRPINRGDLVWIVSMQPGQPRRLGYVDMVNRQHINILMFIGEPAKINPKDAVFRPTTYNTREGTFKDGDKGVVLARLCGLSDAEFADQDKVKGKEAAGQQLRVAVYDMLGKYENFISMQEYSEEGNMRIEATFNFLYNGMYAKPKPTETTPEA